MRLFGGSCSETGVGSVLAGLYFEMAVGDVLVGMSDVRHGHCDAQGAVTVNFFR